MDENGQLTERGKGVSTITTTVGLNLEPIWANAIYEASKLGCMDEVITIAALCSVQKNIFQDQPGMERIASISRAKFAHGPSDHLALLNAFSQYQQLANRDANRDEPQKLCDAWCRLHFLNSSALHDVSELRAAIKTAASAIASEDNDTTTESAAGNANGSRPEASTKTAESESGPSDEVVNEYNDCDGHVDDPSKGLYAGAFDRQPKMEQRDSTKMEVDPRKHASILKAITRAFSTQIAISWGSKDKYCTVETNVTAMLHSSCALVGLQPQWVVYTQLSRRSRLQFLDIVSVVDVDWLLVCI